MSVVASIIQSWRNRSANLRCAEICNDLICLGFSIRDGRRGGHKIVSHSKLFDFYGTNFDCGHGANPIVKHGYVKKLLRILIERREELEILG